MSPAELRRHAAGTLLASFAGDVVPDWVLRRAADGLGGLCLYGSNRGVDIASVATAVHAERPETVLALDEEGGEVTRLEMATGSSLPGNAALGAVDDIDLTGTVARALGAVLREVGVDLDLAPCADVNSDAANPVIGVRSFGADAGLVARHTAAFVTGLQSEGVAACAKHFPGHGAVVVDSHVALPTVDASDAGLRDRELVPFRAAIAAGVAAVMPGHLLVPVLDTVPATVSRAVVTGLLRDRLGFAGLVVTDALDMGGIGGPAAIPANVVRALAAGADLCCLGPRNDDALVAACVDAVVAAVAAGDLRSERVADAAGRVAALRRSLGSSPGSSGTTATPGPPTAPAARSGAGGGSSVPPGPAPVPPGPVPLSAGAASSVREPLAVARAHLAACGDEAATRALRVEGVLPAPLVGAHVVELERPANIAAGAVPWGVAAALVDSDPTATAGRVADGDVPAVAAALAAAQGRPIVVVARDPQRRPAQAAALADLLAARPDAVVVDMGWPDDRPDRPSGVARVVTHGPSPASGRAVACLLSGADSGAGTAGAAPHPSPTHEGRTARG